MARAGELMELLVLGKGGYELGLCAVSAPCDVAVPVRGYERSSNGSAGHYNLSRKSERSDQDAPSHHCGACRGRLCRHPGRLAEVRSARLRPV